MLAPTQTNAQKYFLGIANEININYRQNTLMFASINELSIHIVDALFFERRTAMRDFLNDLLSVRIFIKEI